MGTCFALSPVFFFFFFPNNFKQFQAISNALVATEFFGRMLKNLWISRRIEDCQGWKERRVNETTKHFNEKQRDIWKIGNLANEKITESVNQR